MTDTPLSTDLTRSIARIFNSNNIPIGAGVLVGEDYILTCAHVINDALGRETDCSKKPAFKAKVILDFPIAGNEKFGAYITNWWFDEDVAGLKLVKPLTIPLPPIPLRSVDDLLDQEIDAFGFPNGYDKGLWVKGTVDHRVGKGWVQITGSNLAKTRFITGGFSGGPIWLSDQSGIVGITVESDSEHVANCIPSDILIQLWPELAKWGKPPSCPYRGLFTFREEDVPFFFGREIFSTRLIEAVQHQPLAACRREGLPSELDLQ